MEIHAYLTETVIAWFGDDGRRWLKELPEATARLAEEWELSLGVKPYLGGTHSLVLDATRADSIPLILKIPFVEDENRHEAAVLLHYDGDGAVKLFDYDSATGALLEERLIPGEMLLDLPDRELAIEITCGLVKRLWKPPEASHPFQLVHELASNWTEWFATKYREFEDPFPQELIEVAVVTAAEFADPAENPVVVNRDAHLGNILSAEREPWLLIDPKPLVGDRAFDTGHLLTDLLRIYRNPTPGQADELIDKLAINLNLSSTVIRKWGFLRTIENALWTLDVKSDSARHILQAKALHAGI